MKCWILSTPRTGGNYLSMILNNTGLFIDKKKKHAFDEWLGFYNDKYNLDWFLTKEQIIKSLPTKEWFLSNTPDFVNIHRDQFFNIFKTDSYCFFENQFPEVLYIVLKRKNFLSQVASIHIAKITKTWRLYGEKDQKKYLEKKININSNSVFKCYQEEMHKKNAWNDFSDKHNVLNVWYEELNSNPQETTKKILNFLNLNLPMPRILEAIKLTNNNYKKTRRPETKEVERILRKNINVLI